MASGTLIRWSGVALVLAVLLFPVSMAVHPPDTAAGMSGGMWEAAHSFQVLAMLLSVFGLFGLYARIMAQAGVVGLLGFVIAVISTTLSFGPLWVDSYLIPKLALADPSLIKPLSGEADPALISPVYSLVISIIFVTRGVGFFLLGLAIFRTNVLPRYAGLLYAVSNVIIGLIGACLAVLPDTLRVVMMIGYLVFMVAQVWLGIALIMREDRALQPQVAPVGPVSS